MEGQAFLQLIESIETDVRDLRKALDTNKDAIEKRLDTIERCIKSNGSNGGPKSRFDQWKDIVVLALIAKLLGLNLAQLTGLLGGG